MSADAIFPLSTIRCFPQHTPNPNPNQQQEQPAAPSMKKKRNLPGTPDPEAEVIALSPKSLMATNRFLCEVCNKGFQRDQNLQLHRRGHNLPWKLRQRAKDAAPPRKKVYVCPEKGCVHHDPSRALGDLTGIKKHFSRKHGEKKWKCDRCSKRYAVHSDWKAHSKTCGTREYKCDCGTLFSRKDSFITHRAFCDALTEESARLSSSVATGTAAAMELGFKSNIALLNHNTSNNPHLGFGHDVQLLPSGSIPQFPPMFKPADPSQDGGVVDHQKINLSLWMDHQAAAAAAAAATDPHNLNPAMDMSSSMGFPELLQMATSSTSTFGSYGGCSMPATTTTTTTGASLSLSSSSEKESKVHLGGSLAQLYPNSNQNHMSATALLQKAAQMGATTSSNNSSSSAPSFFGSFSGLMCSTKSMHPENLQNMLMNTFPGEVLVGGGANMQGTSTASNDMIMMMHNTKMNPWGHEVVGNSLTRDFLGLGEDGSHRSFLQQELAKFASMGGSGNMDLMSASYSGGRG